MPFQRSSALAVPKDVVDVSGSDSKPKFPKACIQMPCIFRQKLANMFLSQGWTTENQKQCYDECGYAPHPCPAPKDPHVCDKWAGGYTEVVCHQVCD